MRLNKTIRETAEALADVQATKYKLTAKLKALNDREHDLIASLQSAFSLTKEEKVFTNGDHDLLVQYNEFDRTILDQEQATAILKKLGKKVPMKISHIVTLKVKRV